MPPISVERLMSDSGMNEPMEPAAATGGEQEDITKQATPAPGAQLAAYRKERGWSIEQVASQLNLAPRQIQAIENDDYPALPGMAVARGFVRAYAKLLKADAAPLLAAMSGGPPLANAPLAPQRTLAAPFSEPRFPEITDRAGVSGKHVAVVVAVILVVAGIWIAQESGHLSLVANKLEGGWASLSGVTGEAAKPAPASGEAAVPAATPAPVAETSTTGTIVNEAVPPVPSLPPVAEPNAAPPDAAAAGKDDLVLKVSQDSWIEIKGSGNRTVLSRIMKAGETETVEVKEPLSLVIGNAAGVDITLRGNPLALKANTSSNVARLNLK
jgi:cytoskeleton protein RodZ